MITIVLELFGFGTRVRKKYSRKSGFLFWVFPGFPSPVRGFWKPDGQYAVFFYINFHGGFQNPSGLRILLNNNTKIQNFLYKVWSPKVSLNHTPKCVAIFWCGCGWGQKIKYGAGTGEGAGTVFRRYRCDLGVRLKVRSWIHFAYLCLR